MSTLKVSSIQDINGNPYKGIEFKGYDLSGANGIMLNNITWHTSYNDTVQTIGNPNSFASDDLTDPEVSAIIVIQQLIHNETGAYHGYLGGFYHQDGKDYQDYGAYLNQAMYNQYYTIMSDTLIVPWDPPGTQSLKLYVSNAYHTNDGSGADNYFQILYARCIKGK